jgi:hypothetical protein
VWGLPELTNSQVENFVLRSTTAASNTYFGTSYLSCPDGQYTYWAGPDSPENYFAGGMMVYGDSTIHIF